MPNSSTRARAIAVARCRSPTEPIDRSSSSSSLRFAAAHEDADVVEQFAARHDVAMRGILVADEAERPGGVAPDRDALDRRRMLAEQGADRVARLVRGDDTFLVRRQLRPLDPFGQRPLDVRRLRRSRQALAQPDAGQRPAQGVEVVAAVTRAGRGAFDQVARRAARRSPAPRRHLQVHLPVVDPQDRPAVVGVGVRDVQVELEPAGPQQGGVEDSTKFVVPTTKTSSSRWKPSISVRSWLTIECSTPEPV